MTTSQHVYEIRPRKDKRGVDLISDALPFGRLYHGEPDAISNAMGYALQRSRSTSCCDPVYDDNRPVLACAWNGLNLFTRQLLTPASGIHAGKGQKVDHAKTLWHPVMSGQRRYPIGLHAQVRVRI